MKQDEGFTVTISMKHFAESIEKVPMTKERSRRAAEKISDDERSAAESVIGSLGWLSRQLRADLAFAYSWSAQTKNEFVIGDLTELNISGTSISTEGRARVLMSLPSLQSLVL